METERLVHFFISRNVLFNLLPCNFYFEKIYYPKNIVNSVFINFIIFESNSVNEWIIVYKIIGFLSLIFIVLRPRMQVEL